MTEAAVIKDGVVVNVISIDAENALAFVQNGVMLIDRHPLGLQIGDTTEDGVLFFRDGIQLPIEPEQLPEGDTEEMADMRAALDTLGVVPDETEG